MKNFNETYNLNPKIYVACLVAYNSGYLYDSWIDAAQPVEKLWKAIEEMLVKSSIIDAEEWAIHDYKGFGEISFDEYENLEAVSSIALFLEEHGIVEADLLAHHCNNLEEAIQSMEEYYSCYDSEIW